MRYLKTEKLGSFHLRPFIVLTITERAHYKAESETACRVNVLRGISFLKTVNTLLGESTEGRTGHKGGRAFARTCIHHEVRSAEVPKAFIGLGLGLGISLKEVTGCNSVPHVSSHRLSNRMNSYSVRGCTSADPTLSHETSFAQS